MADEGEDPALAEVMAERDSLRQQVVRLESRTRGRNRLRRWGASLLVVLACVSFTAATTGLWAKRNFLDTSVFVGRVAPLAREAAMQDVISRIVSDLAIQAVDPKRLVSEALPERAQILAGPIGSAVESFIRTQVERFVSSDEFDRLWAATVQQAHRGAVALVRGKEGTFVSAVGGNITINLVPIINAVLANVGKLSPEILGHSVTLPTLTVNDAPDAAVRRLEAALGVNLKDGYGELVVPGTEDLSELQDAIGLFDKLTALLLVATLLFLTLALWVSPRRRRTLLQLCVGIALGLVFIRRMSFYVENHVLEAVKEPDSEAAVRLVLDSFLEPLRAAALWMLAGLALIAAVAMLSGPYPWAVRLRAMVASGFRGLAGLITSGARGARDPRATAWLQANKDKVRIGEAAVFLFALLFLNLPWLVIFLLAAVIGGIELLLASAAPEDSSPPPEAEAIDAGRTGGP